MASFNDVGSRDRRTHYAEVLAAYLARRFDDARAAFNTALEAVPDDGPSRTMLGRIAQFRGQPAGRRLGWRLAAGPQIAAAAEKLILLDNDVRRDLFPGLNLDVLEAFDGDTPMTDLQDRLERFETLTAECELITKLATDSAKREFYLKLSEQYRQLAADMRQAIATKAAA